MGGHCIGVDPYYLTYKAEQLGYHSQIILSGRRINDDMGKYVAESLIKHLIKADVAVKNARVAILGFTFKENCPDTRNTKVIDIVRELRTYGIEPAISDSEADKGEAERLYGICFTKQEEIRDMDAVILAVPHREYRALSLKTLDGFYKEGTARRVLFDIKGMLNKREAEEAGYLYWRL